MPDLILSTQRKMFLLKKGTVDLPSESIFREGGGYSCIEGPQHNLEKKDL
jgi:hypothetical protein